MVDEEIQSTINQYPKWTQTMDEMTTLRSELYQNQLMSQAVGLKEDTKPISKAKTRENSSKIKKKSIISKAAIKKPENMHDVQGDLIFSPGEKSNSSKLVSTMKKSSTMNSQSRISGNFNSSNRFLFRGNEEFHNTVGRHDTHIRSNTEQDSQPLFVGSSRHKQKKDINIK